MLGVAVGIAIFGVGAAMLSIWSLLGVMIAALSGVASVWISFGQRQVVQGVWACLIGSLVAWISMRLMMRWVAMSSSLSPTFTLEGTSAILGTSVMMGVLPAMGYVHFSKRFGHSLIMGMLYGLILSTIGGIPMILILSGEITTIAREPLIPICFLLTVPILYAFLLEVSHRTFGGE